MPHLSEAEVYARMAEALFDEPPLPLDDLFEDSLVRLRTGIVISEAMIHTPKGSWPTHALAVLKRARRNPVYSPTF